jgi:gamma-glutamyltranspeptidase/glutathione hydrolase
MQFADDHRPHEVHDGRGRVLGVVAAGHDVTVRAAADVLASGGNAFDAVVAAGFAASVAEPMLTSVAGGGFLTARTAAGDEVVFDFFCDTPGIDAPPQQSADVHFHPVDVDFGGAVQTFNIGLASVATPGNLAGWLHVHRRLGRVPLDVVTAPAVTAARDGVALNALQAYTLRLLEPIVASYPEGDALYRPGGKLATEGDVLRNPACAAFLVSLDDDSRNFPSDVARAVAAAMRDGGGLVTEADLAGYTVTEREPLRFTYRGRTVLTNPPPSFGGSLIATALGALATTDIATASFGTPEHLVTLAATFIDVERSRHGVVGGDTAAADVSGRVPKTSKGTTHVSVADADGNLAAMTTSNGEGSGWIIPGTGIMTNNMMGEDDLHPHGFHNAPPGERIGSMMAPTLVSPAGDDPAGHWFVLGSGGSKRIRSAVAQVLHGVVDLGLSPAEAVGAPRIHYDGDTLQIEPGFPSGSVAALADLAPGNVWDAPNMYFGGAHVVTSVAPDGTASFGGDPRRGGAGRVVRHDAGADDL